MILDSVYMVSCCVELLAVELVMLFFGEIVIKNREIPSQNRRLAKNTLLSHIEERSRNTHEHKT